jgi:arginine exporter protein ArgO
LFVTHNFEAGAEQFWSLVRTGHMNRSETLTLVVTVGGVAHLLLIVACVAGFLQLRPRMKEWGQFFAGGILALAYFALIVVTTAPR